MVDNDPLPWPHFARRTTTRVNIINLIIGGDYLLDFFSKNMSYMYTFRYTLI